MHGRTTATTLAPWSPTTRAADQRDDAARRLRATPFHLLAIALLGLAAVTGAQEREDRTLLSQADMTAIVNEASGERAMHHLLELVPYQFVRPAAEYRGQFREAEVMARFAKAYGFANVTIEDFPAGPAWQPVSGELWMTSPRSVKLFDIHDVPEALASTNANGDISGELIDVGWGRAQDFEGKDLTGKFALSLATSGLAGVYNLAVARGGLGALGISAIGTQRASDFPGEIVSTTVNATRPGTAAWALTPAGARDLAASLARGDRVVIRSVTKAEQVPAKLQVVHAEIPGDGSTTQEVAVSAHLFEGYLKQGANDDNSGCAVTLEIGRTYLKLIAEGKLPKPKRTVNFQWVPEISGTNAWLTAHPEKARAIIGDLNFDMEGLHLSRSRAFWILQRTPDTFPSYLNDIAQSMMEYVADVSRERVRFRANGYGPSQPIESVNGSRDAFYIKIDKHYGSSDHVTYMQHGIPAVMFVTWPDMWYHSSQDTPDKLDATQFKRVAVVGTGALAVLASGTDEMAARVLGENVGRGLARMGDAHVKGLGYLADVKDAASLPQAYKEARVAILHQARVEKGVVSSAAVLWTDVEEGRRRASAFGPLIDQRASALLNEVRAVYQLQADQRGAPAAEPAPTPEEREAANLVVEPVAGAGRGGRGGRGGGPGGPAPAAAATLPQEMSAEFNILIGQRRTVLEIRDFLSGEFTPVPLQQVMAVLRAREAGGSIRLVPKEPAPAGRGSSPVR